MVEDELLEKGKETLLNQHEKFSLDTEISQAIYTEHTVYARCREMRTAIACKYMQKIEESTLLA